ncbi:MAG: YifB family Mg chelatase-like AAA ATPase [Treponema sp.]|nr:YifB family Mg chelatase-like AAA ATPase [Treponema sp.]
MFSFSPFGYEGSLVTVEVDLRRGIPAIDIVGLADGAVKESRERMRAAIKNSRFDFPPERVLISLSPADMKKEGSGFDLAIALAVLVAQESGGCCYNENAKETAGGNSDVRKNRLSTVTSDDILIMGELELSGRVRSVRAVHAAASTAASGGIMRCIVPAADAGEAREVPGMKVYGADSLECAFNALSHPELFTERGESVENAFIPAGCTELSGILFPPVPAGFEFADITGQPFLIRGLQIAAAGGHNLLAVGAPGCGKTMALQKFSALLPLLTVEEAQPVTRIYSLAGLMPNQEPLIRIAPFRQPHQTATIQGMCGGGPSCIPGEISLAHNGVLFLDEAAEFRSSVLQMLRVPIESGSVTLARAGRSTVYPASFQLLMAANPCPCGNFGSKTRVCLCSARSVEQYWKKFSAPLLDRIDIRIPVENIPVSSDRLSSGSGNRSLTTTALRKEIARAVAIQRDRQGCRNARLTPQNVAGYCSMMSGARSLLDAAAQRYGFSPRAVSSCLRISRTIADMSGAEIIQEEHVQEAVNYRKGCSSFLSEDIDI